MGAAACAKKEKLARMEGLKDEKRERIRTSGSFFYGSEKKVIVNENEHSFIPYKVTCA